VIDLHCHLLPAVDDGSGSMEASVVMARVAVEGGVEAIVATPHVSGTYPNDPRTFEGRVGDLQSALDAGGVPLRVHRGAELAVSMVPDLVEEQLEACRLGDGSYLMVEPPLIGPSPFLERLVGDLVTRGFRIVLAHPERIPAFQHDIALLEKLVAQGALCSVTAMSVAGRFGRPVREFSEELFRRGLVHNLASDAHDAEIRSPALRSVLDEAAAGLPGLADALPWLTVEVPRAILAGEAVTADPPRIGARKQGLFGRLARRAAT
jgi:protein-tyrosine phosphatase